MKRILPLALALFGASGCYDFRDDLLDCVRRGDCAAPDAGAAPVLDAGTAATDGAVEPWDGGHEGPDTGHAVQDAGFPDGGKPGVDGGGPAPGQICSPSNWCWETPLPHNALNSILAFSKSDLWAFGEHGTVLHNDGSAWRYVPGATASLGQAIAFAPDDMFVATSGGLLHFDGSVWIPTYPGHDVYSVSGSSGSDLWVILGWSGDDLRHFTGTGTWDTVMPAGRWDGLRALYTLPSGKTWAVCWDGAIYVWDGTDWTEEVSPTTNRLDAVWAVDEDEAWAVGELGTVLHRKSGAWTSVPSNTAFELYAVAGNSASDVWMVGSDGTSLHWNGSTLSAKPIDGRLYALAMAEGEPWTVGDGGVIDRWDGAAWRSTPIGSMTPLNDVHGTSGSDVWVVGNGNLVRHFDGQAWTDLSAGGTADLNRVIALPTGDIWVAGNQGELKLRPAGSKIWKKLGSAADNFWAMWASSPTDAWAVGPYGVVFHSDGATSAEVDSGTWAELNDVWGSGPEDVWVVGAGGLVLKCSTAAGPACTTISLGTTANLRSVCPLAPDDVWIVDESRTFHHWDGSTWGEVDLGLLEYPNVMRPAGTSGRFYVGANNGVLMVGDETGLEPLDSGTNQVLWGIFGDAATYGFAVGWQGTLLRWIP